MDDFDTHEAPRAAVVPAFGQRMPAPEHLTPQQAEEWRAIVDSLPADYFRPGDVGLLAAYCIASAMHKEAAAILARDGLVVTTDSGKPYAHPAAGILAVQAGSMAQMAVKLRLCPSARYDAQKRQTVAKRAGGSRPWEEAA